MFRLAYNTNGLAHHRLVDALHLLADLGYEGVALTPDVGHLDPFHTTVDEVHAVRRAAEDLGLAIAVESGARFLLDPARKHFPSLLEDRAEDRERRLDFLERTLELAAELGAPLVSLWAGVAPCGTTAEGGDGERREVLWQRLQLGLRRLLEHAESLNVALAFEPEPGMFVERPAGYEELRARLGPDGASLGLCLDVGHLLVTGDRPEAEVIRRLGPLIAHVHLDDIADGRHEHLPFGKGDLDLRGVLHALLDVHYRGMAAVELSRDSHRGAQAARDSMAALRQALLSSSTPEPTMSQPKSAAPRYVTKPTAMSLWQEYRVYADHLELDSVPWGTVRVPFEDLKAVAIRPPLVVFDFFRGDYGVKELSRTAKLDLADLAEHIAIEKNGFWKQLRITPNDPARFKSEVDAAVAEHRRKR